MAIPESQLTTWAQIGAQTTSRDTYATVKRALESEDAAYYGRNFAVFLQGSYGNATNICRESDVGVVIRLDAIFTYDISGLPLGDQAAFAAVHPNATYTHKNFSADVLDVLRARFEADVVPGTKAVLINPRGTRRKADVIIATQHRTYHRFAAVGDAEYTTGISFHKSDGTRVINFPIQHRDNLVVKNQATAEWFKHLVRICKNARQRMIDDGMIEQGIAPSYYIEGLLYNVPDEKFGSTYVDSMVNAINWLLQADRGTFVCPNQQYPLLDGKADVTWNVKDCDAYLNGLASLWKQW